MILISKQQQQDIIYTKYNISILKAYLYKDAINNGLTQSQARQFVESIVHKHRNNLFGTNSLAQSLGKRSFTFFCLYYLQDYFVPKPDNLNRELAPVHYEIWQELESMFLRNTHDKQQFILPRGVGKTTVVDMALSVWLHSYKLSTYTLVLANLQDDAEGFLDNTKKAFNSPYIVHTFGELVQPRKRTVNKLELELDNDTKIKAYSSSTSVRGTSYISSNGIYRPTCIIADDYISENDILTEDSKNKKYIRYQKEVEDSGDTAVYRDGKLIKPATKFIVIGTPLAQGDFIDSIKNNVEYKTFHRSIVDFDVDDYFNNNKYWQQYKSILFDTKRDNPVNDAREYYLLNKPHMEFPTIWNKYDCERDVARDYFTKRLAFMQEKMCNVANIGDKWFKSNRTMPLLEVEDNTFTKTMLSVDPAGVKNKNKAKSDYFAFVVGSLSDNNFKFVRTAQLRKFDEFDEYINHVILLLKDFDDITHVYIEKNTYNGLDVDAIKNEINKHDDLKNRNITFINEMQRKNKDEKISTIVDAVNNGRIIFCEDRTESDFLKQVMDFSGQMFSYHDDAVDCLAEFANRIDDISKEVESITFLPHIF